MKILVTGGAGYIGSAFVSSLVAARHDVVVFDDLSSGQSEKVSKKARLVEGDLTDKNAILEVCKQEPFDAVNTFKIYGI